MQITRGVELTDSRKEKVLGCMEWAAGRHEVKSVACGRTNQMELGPSHTHSMPSDHSHDCTPHPWNGPTVKLLNPFPNGSLQCHGQDPLNLPAEGAQGRVVASPGTQSHIKEESPFRAEY